MTDLGGGKKPVGRSCFVADVLDYVCYCIYRRGERKNTMTLKTTSK